MIKKDIVIIACTSSLLIACFQKENSNPQAVFSKGTVLWFGDGGTEKKQTEACKLFKKASEMGHIEAQFNLGNCYRKGVSKHLDSIELAEYWYLKAHNAGLSEASISLATLYIHEFKEDKYLKNRLKY